MVWSAIGASTGARFTSATLTRKLRAAASGGVPLSVTMMPIWKLPGPWAGPCASVGVQANAPVTGSIVAPSGAPSPRRKVSVCDAPFGSEALAVKENSSPSLID